MYGAELRIEDGMHAIITRNGCYGIDRIGKHI